MSQKKSKKISKILIVHYSLLFSFIIFFVCNKDNNQAIGTKPIIPQKVYTEENPGNWKNIKDEHLPRVTIYKNRKQNIVVHVPIRNPSQKHYIEKIAIVEVEEEKENIQKNNNEIKDAKLKVKKELAVKLFSRHAKYFEAIFSLHPVPSGKEIIVYSKCNLHDLWTIPLSEAKYK